MVWRGLDRTSWGAFVFFFVFLAQMLLATVILFIPIFGKVLTTSLGGLFFAGNLKIAQTWKEKREKNFFLLFAAFQDKNLLLRLLPICILYAAIFFSKEFFKWLLYIPEARATLLLLLLWGSSLLLLFISGRDDLSDCRSFHFSYRL